MRKTDAAFIAACAGPAEAMARSTIAAIEGLRVMRKQCHEVFFAVEGWAEVQLDLIIAAWPEELL